MQAPQVKERMAPAVVLCRAVTGLATVRGLATAGVPVQAIVFDSHDPLRFSRRCDHVSYDGPADDEDALLAWLVRFLKQARDRPVLIPTSDSHALMLARNHDQLAPHCLLSTCGHQDLQRIIDKGALYDLAGKAGVPVIPSTYEPTLEQLDRWSEDNPGPYFLKPIYEAAGRCALGEKNMVLQDRQALRCYVARNGSEALIIQRMIRGGDGYIFDCYGLCGVGGRVLTMASHRRWRQYPPNVGTTTFGEIPAHPEGMNESVLFDYTARLLGTVKYHGIFGIEWLQDRETGELYLIDFNARPFSSIGHLFDCGLNLPYLAYCELTGADLSALQLTPRLEHRFWVDLLRDLSSASRQGYDLKGWLNWAASVLRCRGFAYWDWRDPGPGLYRGYQLATTIAQSLGKKLWPLSARS
jgi:predicted ATP-grasp superfamily ATP-dependent carboligase